VTADLPRIKITFISIIFDTLEVDNKTLKQQLLLLLLLLLKLSYNY
jgi:hypothetical protein